MTTLAKVDNESKFKLVILCSKIPLVAITMFDKWFKRSAVPTSDANDETLGEQLCLAFVDVVSKITDFVIIVLVTYSW